MPFWVKLAGNVCKETSPAMSKVHRPGGALSPRDCRMFH